MIRVDRKKWGLVSKSGTSKNPLYASESDLIKLCFSSLCFNARSDTLYSKPTFSKLAHGKRTCIIALDGYFEWKSSPSRLCGKQPYFVYRKQNHSQQHQRQQQRQPLLIAGLWTRVATGLPEAPTLDSFAMLTTEASEQIEWLHHRMPLCVWDTGLAKKWLLSPSEAVKKELDDLARSNKHNDAFAWHKVSPEMGKLTYRSKEAIVEMKETTQSVKNFFGPATTTSKEGTTTKPPTKKLAPANNYSTATIATPKASPCLSSSLSSSTTSKHIAVLLALGEKKRKPSTATFSTTASNFSPKKKKLENNDPRKSKISRSTTKTATTPKNSSNKQLSINTFFQTKQQSEYDKKGC